MRILQIYKDYYPPVKGGIEGHINLLAHGLKERGVQVQVLVSNTRARLERSNIDSIPVTRVPQLGRVASTPVNPFFPLWLKKLGSEMDILHFHFPCPTTELSYLVSRLCKKVVVTYHSDIVRQKVLGKFYAPFLLRFLKRVQTIIVASPNYLHSSPVLRRFRHKCIVVSYGIDLTRFSPYPQTGEQVASTREKHGSRIVLFIGRFRYYKGLDVLIDAMRQVRGKLLLIGAGRMERELRRWVAEGALEDKIVFLGELSDQEAVTYLQACDVFVLPSILRSEAFGIAQLEAMACGKPIVCTELGTGTTFVNRHRETGLVVPPSDAPALTAAINLLLENKRIREQYGRAARQRVTKYFSKETMIDNILAIYEGCQNVSGVPGFATNAETGTLAGQ